MLKLRSWSPKCCLKCSGRKITRPNTWAITITEGGVEIRAGSGVEDGPSFIAEGAWAGEFSAEEFLTSSFRCGSVVVFELDSVVLGAPHSVEAIYCFVRAGRLIASNSLHMIVARDESARPPSLGRVRRASRTLNAGRRSYARVLYETASGMMRKFAFGTIRFST